MLDVNKFQDKGVVHSSMFGKRQRAWSEGSETFFFFFYFFVQRGDERGLWELEIFDFELRSDINERFLLMTVLGKL